MLYGFQVQKKPQDKQIDIIINFISLLHQEDGRVNIRWSTKNEQEKISYFTQKWKSDLPNLPPPTFSFQQFLSW